MQNMNIQDGILQDMVKSGLKVTKCQDTVE